MGAGRRSFVLGLAVALGIAALLLLRFLPGTGTPPGGGAPPESAPPPMGNPGAPPPPPGTPRADPTPSSPPAQPVPPAAALRTLEGRVLGPDGKSPAFATVRIRPAEADPREDASVDTDAATGRFRIEGLPPGPLLVEARAFGQPVGRCAEAAVPGNGGTVELVLPRPSRLRLLVVDEETGGPVGEDGEIRLVRDDGEYQIMIQSGGFGREGHPLEVVPGAVIRLRAVADGYLPGEIVEASRPEGEEEVEVPLTLRRDPDPALLVLEFSDESGVAPPLVSVTRIDPGTRNCRVLRREPEDGRVTLALREGRHLLGVGAHPRDDDRADPFLREEFEVLMVRGERTVRPVRLVRGGFLRVLGRSDFDGVTAVLRSGETRIERPLLHCPDEEGFLVGGTLPVGPWTLEFAGLPGAVPLEVEVRAGRTTTVTVEVRPGPR